MMLLFLGRWLREWSGGRNGCNPSIIKECPHLIPAESDRFDAVGGIHPIMYY